MILNVKTCFYAILIAAILIKCSLEPVADDDSTLKAFAVI